MDGSIGERAQCSIDFKKMIEDEIKGVNVVLIDERWTTKQATRFLLEGDLSRAKRKKVIDKMAAQVILDTYIQLILTVFFNTINEVFKVFIRHFNISFL